MNIFLLATTHRSGDAVVAGSSCRPCAVYRRFYLRIRQLAEPASCKRHALKERTLRYFASVTADWAAEPIAFGLQLQSVRA